MAATDNESSSKSKQGEAQRVRVVESQADNIRFNEALRRNRIATEGGDGLESGADAPSLTTLVESSVGAQLLAWALEAATQAEAHVKHLGRLKRDPEVPRALVEAMLASATTAREKFAAAMEAAAKGSVSTLFANCYAVAAGAARKLSAADVKQRRHWLSIEYPFRSVRKGAKDPNGPQVEHARASLHAALARAVDHITLMLRNPKLFDAELSYVAPGADSSVVETELLGLPFTEMDGAINAMHMAGELLRDKTAARPLVRRLVPEHLVSKLGKAGLRGVLDTNPSHTEKERIRAELRRLAAAARSNNSKLELSDENGDRAKSGTGSLASRATVARPPPGASANRPDEGDRARKQFHAIGPHNVAVMIVARLVGGSFSMVRNAWTTHSATRPGQ